MGIHSVAGDRLLQIRVATENSQMKRSCSWLRWRLRISYTASQVGMEGSLAAWARFIGRRRMERLYPGFRKRTQFFRWVAYNFPHCVNWWFRLTDHGPFQFGGQRGLQQRSYLSRLKGISRDLWLAEVLHEISSRSSFAAGSTGKFLQSMTLMTHTRKPLL